MNTVRLGGPTNGVFTVYRFYDEAGVCLYVGVTGRGVNRLKQHGDKVWFPYSATVGLEHFGTLKEASEREAQLIELLKPTHGLGALCSPVPDLPVVPDLPQEPAA